MAKFRFQDMEIRQESIELADILLGIADDLEEMKMFRFTDQLRGAAMSVSNNIAEGSGSFSKTEFKQFLNIARRSAFENANILILLGRHNLLQEEQLNPLLDRLDILSRKITSFRRSLDSR